MSYRRMLKLPSFSALVALGAAAMGLGSAGCGPKTEGPTQQICNEAGVCMQVPIDAGAPREGSIVEAVPPDTLPAPHVLVSIQVNPSNPIDFIDNGTPAIQKFTALGIYADGKNADVTPLATWSNDKPALGGFAAGADPFTSMTTGGFTKVTATVAGLMGNTTLTLVPRRVDTSGMPLDFFFIAPYTSATTPASAILTFGTTIQSADVGFIIDVSYSEDSKIANLRSAISGMTGTLATVIPSVGEGIAEFSSWPCGADGSSGDYPWKLDNRIITVGSAGLAQVQASLATVMTSITHIGGDGSEDDFDALYFAATGVTQSDCGGGTVPGFSDSTAPGFVAGETDGVIGGMGFRAGALPVLVIVTDAEFHDADNPADTTFNPPGPLAHGHNAVLAAMKAINGRVVGIASEGGGADFSPNFAGASPDSGGSEPHSQEVWMAEQTGTVVPVAAFAGACGAGLCCTGLSSAGEAPDASGNCPLVYRVDNSGSGLGSSITDAISKLVTFGVMDVGTQITGKTTDESTPPVPLPGTHTTADFLLPIGSLKGVTPLDSIPAVGSTGSPPGPTAIDTAKGEFLNVNPGTKVRFTVKVYNDFINAIPGTPQFFKANIQVLGNGATFLDQRDVYILVPPSMILH